MEHLLQCDVLEETLRRQYAFCNVSSSKILKQMPQSGAFSQICVDLDESDIERLPYPVLLQATDADGVSLRNNPLTNECVNLFAVSCKRGELYYLRS